MNQKAQLIREALRMYADGEYSDSIGAHFAEWISAEDSMALKDEALSILWQESLETDSNPEISAEAFRRWSTKNQTPPKD